MLTVVATLLSGCVTQPLEPVQTFHVRALDAATGRPIPLVKVSTVNHVARYTDNGGYAAFSERDLMNTEVFFNIESDGYALPPDSFGFRGVRLLTSPGAVESVALERTQVAERLYRATGQGRWQHSPSPESTALPGRVLGQDTVMAVPLSDRVRWFWGDTLKPSYPLGNFAVATATSPLPHDALQPPRLRYAEDRDGFARPVFPDDMVQRPGAIWVHGVFALQNADAAPQIVAHYARHVKIDDIAEHGIAVFDADRQLFIPKVSLPDGHQLHPTGQALQTGGYVYFASPFPVMRVPASLNAALDPTRYEGLVCRDGPCTWQRGEAPLYTPEVIDADSDERIDLHAGSVRWNPHRERWVMIANRRNAPESRLGEVYYAEAPRLEGPWRRAVKIATHTGYSFYNPVHHDFFDQDGGRVVFFEGTYSNTFSRTVTPVPRYDYNQLMYRLNLDDPRIVAVFGAASAGAPDAPDAPDAR